MDSLLIILVVIGVIMILAGVARMRSKRRRSWDDIDHSVLFSRSGAGQGRDDVESGELPSMAGSRIEDEGLERDALQRLEPMVAELPERELLGPAEALEIRVDTDEDRPVTRSAAPVAGQRVRSILDKLRGGEALEAEAPEAGQPAPRRGHKQDAPDKVIVLNVMAPRGQHFVGPALVQAIEASGLSYGDGMQIFQYLEQGVPLFGLVNMVKPGVFDLATLDQLSTPGVSLFVQMPSDAASGLAAFERMLAVAQQLAATLGGELRDETRSVLTHSAIDHVRQQIAEYDCKWLASA